MEKKKLGILGGMGSEATVLFYKKSEVSPSGWEDP